MKEKNDVRGKIICLLKKNPDGLTILDISKELKTNRATVTKYVYELAGAGTIICRKIGVAKLCIFNKDDGKKRGTMP